MTPLRLPPPRIEPLPELAEFLVPFRCQFARAEGYHALERYLTGLLAEHPSKNCDTIAQVVPGTSEQCLQGLLTHMAWDEDVVNRQRAQWMHQLARQDDGVLIVDDTAFVKQGRHSVGVGWQHAPTLGKIVNCQITINCHYAEQARAWPIATRLYLPRDWANDPVRRARARVPETVTFQTKAEIALALVDQAQAWKVRWNCVVANADHGDNPDFLAGLEERQQGYVVTVRGGFAVTLSRRGGTTHRADAVVAAQPRSAWRTLGWRTGRKSRHRARFLALRCWRVLPDAQRRAGWLIAEQPPGQPPADCTYHWSNLPLGTALERLAEYAHRQREVEPFHQAARERLGWHQYQGRLWTGFHRNAVCVLLAYSFLVWQQRC